MIITNVYKQVNNNVVKLDLKLVSPKHIFKNTELNVKYFVEVEYEDTLYTLNALNMFRETDLLQSGSINKTWEELATELNEVILMSYKEEVSNEDDPKKALTFKHILSDPNIDIAYTNIYTPYERNIKHLKYRLTDLVLTSKSTRFKFDNTICSVNGLICEPTIFNNEMYLKDGAKFCYSTNEHKYPDIILMDFTELGKMKVHNKDMFTMINDTDVKLNVNLSDVTVFPVVYNTLFFPYNLKILTNNIVRLETDKFDLSKLILKRNNQMQTYLKDTEIIDGDFNLDQLKVNLKDNLFFIIVENPNINIITRSLDNFHLNVQFSKKIDSALFDINNNTILDYTKVFYDSIIDSYTNVFKDYLIAIESNKLLGLVKSKCRRMYQLDNLNKQNIYELKMLSI